jgi:ribosomal protein S18 acetylase RimI-like enzyme
MAPAGQSTDASTMGFRVALQSIRYWYSAGTDSPAMKCGHDADGTGFVGGDEATLCRVMTHGIRYDDDGTFEWSELEALFNEVGWTRRTKDRALLVEMVRGTRFYVTAHDGSALVGFARAIGDGVFNAYISTVVVRASHRGRGIGRAMIERLLARGGETTKWVLHSSAEAVGFYGKLGFEPATSMFVRSPRVADSDD